MENDLAHKHPGWFPTTISELCIGDKFAYKDFSCTYTYMGIFRYSCSDYFVYKSGMLPHILPYNEVKDRVVFIRK